MVTDEMIRRINELAKKSKTEGLTPAEAAEQKALRSCIPTARGRKSKKEESRNSRFARNYGITTRKAGHCLSGRAPESISLPTRIRRPRPTPNSASSGISYRI